ncbi:MAG: 3-phosphoshikimate 1-carboxyvinyltransferase, partial [Anaerovoracaceae bacterium]
DLHSAQGDKAILSLLSSREIDGRQVPDLLPILAAKAAVTPGTTRFIHAERLRLKESDRLRAICQNINALGGCCRETTDGLILEGRSLTGGTVEGYNDHRIVMAMAILATVCNDPVTIVGGEAVNKSYPDFFNDYRLLGGDVIEV